MKYGFVQLGKWRWKRAFYPGNKIRVSSLEGMGWHLDRYGPDIPWIEDAVYDLEPGTDDKPTWQLVYNIPKRRSILQQEGRVALKADEFAFHTEFRRGRRITGTPDRPGIMFTDKYVLDGEKPFKFWLVGAFQLFLVTTTDSGIPAADHRNYAMAYQTQKWEFRAIGRVENNDIRHPDNASLHDDYNNKDLMWGAYGATSFTVPVPGTTLETLENAYIMGADSYEEDPLYQQEYPHFGGEAGGPHEDWSTLNN